MSLLINPGSGPVLDGAGWTNSYEGALAEAHKWHDLIRSEGIEDVELILPGQDSGSGRWTFEFRHLVSGVVVTLITHGLSNVDAYIKKMVFPPRVYWNGSSTAEPKIEDWLKSGFEVVKTLQPVTS